MIKVLIVDDEGLGGEKVGVFLEEERDIEMVGEC